MQYRFTFGIIMLTSLFLCASQSVNAKPTTVASTASVRVVNSAAEIKVTSSITVDNLATVMSDLKQGKSVVLSKMSMENAKPNQLMQIRTRTNIDGFSTFIDGQDGSITKVANSSGGIDFEVTGKLTKDLSEADKFKTKVYNVEFMF